MMGHIRLHRVEPVRLQPVEGAVLLRRESACVVHISRQQQRRGPVDGQPSRGCAHGVGAALKVGKPDATDLDPFASKAQQHPHGGKCCAPDYPAKRWVGGHGARHGSVRIARTAGYGRGLRVQEKVGNCCFDCRLCVCAAKGTTEDTQQ